MSDNDDNQTPLTHKEYIKVGRPFKLLNLWDDSDTLANSMCQQSHVHNENLGMITIFLN